MNLISQTFYCLEELSYLILHELHDIYESAALSFDLTLFLPTSFPRLAEAAACAIAQLLSCSYCSKEVAIMCVKCHRH